MDAKKRVAIVGAGISGLSAIKSCLEEGLEPVCFEQYDNLGGVWHYTEEYREGQGARAFDNLTTNISKEMFSFSDFPIPSHFPPFLTCSMVHDYLKSYCENFGLGKHIHLNTKVINIRKSSDYNVTGRWEVETEEPQKTQRDIFDFVMICSGFYKKPRFPDVEGMDTFRGSIEHSMKFKDAARYKGMNVLVVGNSNSSGDLAAESARFAHQVYYSVGEGMWMVPSIVKNGMPYDLVLLKRSNLWNASKFSKVVANMCNDRLDHVLGGICPSSPPSRSRRMVNDKVQYNIMNGRIKVVKTLTRLGPHEAEFDDGTILKNLDAILFATGYQLLVDFLDHEESYKGDNGKLNLYKMMFPLWHHHTLSLVGCVDTTGSFPPLTELQGRLAARVFAGYHRLPSLEVMADDVEKTNSFVLQRFGRYKYLMPTIISWDELAADLGVAPSWWDLIKAGPRLAYLYYYGPAFPYYHRMWGPHPWRGARDAIDHALEHGHYAKQVRHVQGPDHEGSSFMPRFIIVSVLAVLLTTMYNG
ncbi:flavin-containing monooxygenase 5-like isoform X1 [Haliotis rufescens]|uniref:flavin-containing monooxygenase 5-like isoform X1 n=2 Tax=Haliotis rufescens TaxID=6454 RepID=UPI00201F9E3B|nr:flavin-containing monooxygenase 5-like isoform X1 [Haliotis rufescens]XP_046375797.2 flavin-containing monooxygenase 5-like isoform X1 [Haliotis rufescens]